MDASATSFNLRCTGNVIQLNVAARGLCFDLAIALGYLDRPAASLERHYLGPSNVEVPTARLCRNMARRGHQLNASAAGRCLNVISNLADLDISATAGNSNHAG